MKEGAEVNPEFILKNLREKNANRLIIANLNINFLANKFETLRTFVVGEIDILLISETKIDKSSPLTQFTLEGFSTAFRADRNSHGDGLIIYIRDDIPSKEIKVKDLPCDIEGIFIDVIIGKNKWLRMGGYNPPKEKISYYSSHVSKVIDKCMGNYDNIILLGDFNVATSEDIMNDFCQMHKLCFFFKDFYSREKFAHGLVAKFSQRHGKT